MIENTKWAFDIDNKINTEGFQAFVVFQSAFDEAEKSYGNRAFRPATTDIQSPEIIALREAGIRLHQWGGMDAMVSAAIALVKHEPIRFYGIGVLLNVVWSGVGAWPRLKT